jgi:hypothetical protein
MTKKEKTEIITLHLYFKEQDMVLKSNKIKLKTKH